MEDNKYKDVVLTRTANSGEQTYEYDKFSKVQDTLLYVLGFSGFCVGAEIVMATRRRPLCFEDDRKKSKCALTGVFGLIFHPQPCTCYRLILLCLLAAADLI